jgi:hypothetical protein
MVSRDVPCDARRETRVLTSYRAETRQASKAEYEPRMVDEADKEDARQLEDEDDATVKTG